MIPGVLNKSIKIALLFWLLYVLIPAQQTYSQNSSSGSENSHYEGVEKGAADASFNLESRQKADAQSGSVGGTILKILTGISFLTIVSVGGLLLFLPEARGRFYMMQGNYEKAAEIYDAIIKVKPEKLKLYPILANLYMLLNQTDESAIEVFETAMRLNGIPHRAQTINSILASHYLCQGRSDAVAIDIMEKELSARQLAQKTKKKSNSYQNDDPQTVVLLKALGSAYLGNSENYKAVDKFKQLVEFGIDENGMLSNYALALARTDRTDKEALKVYDQIIRDEKTSTTLHVTLATLFLRENIISPPALNVFLQALKQSPPFENEIHLALQNIFSELDGAVSRTEVCQTLLENSQSTGLLRIFLQAVWQEQKYDAALSVLKELLRARQSSVYLQAFCQTLFEKKATMDEHGQTMHLTPFEIKMCLQLRDIDEPIKHINDIDLYLDLKNLFLALNEPESTQPNRSKDEYEFVVANDALDNINSDSENQAAKTIEPQFDLIKDLVDKINRVELTSAGPASGHSNLTELFLSQLNTVAFFEIENFDKNLESSRKASGTFLRLIARDFDAEEHLLCKLDDGLLCLAHNAAGLLRIAIDISKQLERYNQVVTDAEAITLRIVVYRSPVPFLDLENDGLTELRKAIKLQTLALGDLTSDVKVDTDQQFLLVNEFIAKTLKGIRFARLGLFHLKHLRQKAKVFKIEYHHDIGITKGKRQTRSAAKNYASKYQVSEILMENQLWSTFRAYDDKSDRQVIIKAYKALAFEEFKEFLPLKKQFYEEIRKLNKINHANISLTYDVGQDGDTLFLVREFVDGQSLSERQTSLGVVDIETTVSLYIEICQILETFHQNKLWHKNLKPNNIWLSNRDQIKLVDAGILQVRHTDRVWTDDTNSQPYVAPEQIQGMRLTRGCDNFLLGIMLYESLTGVHPFRGQNAADSRVRILADDPPLASSLRPEISGHLDGILRKSLSKHPGQRYQSITEFESDLRMASLDEADIEAHALANKN